MGHNASEVDQQRVVLRSDLQAGEMRSAGSTKLAVGIGLRAACVAMLAYLIIHLLTTTQLYATALVLIGIAVLLVADIVRVLGRVDRSIERFVENLGAEVVERPVHGLAMLERAADKLNVARAERRRQLDYLSTLLDTVAAALIVMRADGRIDLVNRAARKLAQKSVSHLDAIKPLAAVAATLQALAPGERRIIRTADGQPMLASVAQFSVPGTAPLRLLALQRVAGELDAVELKAWQDMAGVLAHEMMNSLTPIASLSESLELLLRDASLRAEPATSDEVAGALEAIKRRSRGLMDFVDRYRKLAELPEPQLQSVAAADFIASIERLLSASCKARSIALHSRMTPSQFSFVADPQLLEQAVINLLRNALDAAAESSQPRVDLACELEESRVSIAVADNGAGLTHEVREQIFVPFFTTKPGGSGIGLNLARHIALAHGGQLDVSANEPQGSVFTLNIPLR